MESDAQRIGEKALGEEGAERARQEVLLKDIAGWLRENVLQWKAAPKDR